MVVRRGLPDELQTLLKRLVANGSVRIAGTLLYAWFRRCWELDDETAAYYMRRYFEKYFSRQLQSLRKHSGAK
ncbi:Uncharacterised protein [Chlamydia abortus]|nr:Uncharacterised protein [Chlamydia abortus]